MSDHMLLLAGPCSMESKEVCFESAEAMCGIADELGLNYYYKTSFDKANRTSLSSWRGLGMDKGLEILAEVKERFGCKIVTDIHEAWQAERAAEVVDMLQIPAFLCRQTDLLVAAAKTGKPVNVKKAQFLAPSDMRYVSGKLEGAGCKEVYLCERGTALGYNNLVVDMRSIPEMQAIGPKVIFDATHSVQRPSAGDGVSGGDRSMVRTLALAAAAAGADGFFFETHPDPNNALCDGPNMLPLSQMKKMLEDVLAVRAALGYSA
ncbi:MAG: 3-deoxy-8-phosphooctulonate synthase [Atopobiaceae bacterium]|nr:3-deoxy-8-phosphooctulonate synthase [Atopobiaceae bacterium]